MQTAIPPRDVATMTVVKKFVIHQVICQYYTKLSTGVHCTFCIITNALVCNIFKIKLYTSSRNNNNNNNNKLGIYKMFL